IAIGVHGHTDWAVEPRHAAVAIGAASLSGLACNGRHISGGRDHSNRGVVIIYNVEISVFIRRHVGEEIETRVGASAVSAALLSREAGEVGEAIVLTASQQGRGR